MSTDTTLSAWLDISEQWARSYAAAPNDYASRDSIHERATDLWRDLLTRYSVEQLDAAWNERCAPILGRTFNRWEVTK